MTELEQIEQQIKQNTGIRDMYLALGRLKKNKDFQKVFLDYYTGEYAADRVMAKAAQDGQVGSDTYLIDQQINAIGHFGVFMDMLSAAGANAKVTIEEAERVRDELINGEAI